MILRMSSPVNVSQRHDIDSNGYKLLFPKVGKGFVFKKNLFNLATLLMCESSNVSNNLRNTSELKRE